MLMAGSIICTLCILPRGADTTVFRSQLLRCGHEHFDITFAHSLDEAVASAARGGLQAAVVDLSRVADAPAVAARIVARVHLPLVAIIAESAGNDVELALLREGVHEIISAADITGCGLALSVARALCRVHAERQGRNVGHGEQAAAAVLSRLPMAVILVDSGGKVVLSNPRGDRILAARDGLSVDAGGVLRADVAEDSRSLASLIARCASGALGETDGTLAISRSPDKPSLGVLVTPLGKTDERRGAAIFVSEPEAPLDLQPRALETLYGMSHAEARLVLHLLQGERIETAAEQLSISPHTARNQLKNVFRKTGITRQAELVKLILTGPAVLNVQPAADKSGTESRRRAATD